MIKTIYPILMEAIGTLKDVTKKIEMTICLANYGVSLVLTIQSDGLGNVLNSTVKLASHLAMEGMLKDIID